MERVGTVAKYWGVRPSSYFPELDTLAAFALDEAIAYVVAERQQKKDKESGSTSADRLRPQVTDPLGMLLADPRFREPTD
jgi:hypothetical protein